MQYGQLGDEGEADVGIVEIDAGELGEAGHPVSQGVGVDPQRLAGRLGRSRSRPIAASNPGTPPFPSSPLPGSYQLKMTSKQKTLDFMRGAVDSGPCHMTADLVAVQASGFAPRASRPRLGFGQF